MLDMLIKDQEDIPYLLLFLLNKTFNLFKLTAIQVIELG